MVPSVVIMTMSIPTATREIVCSDTVGGGRLDAAVPGARFALGSSLPARIAGPGARFPGTDVAGAAEQAR